MNNFEFTIDKDNNGIRIDKFLSYNIENVSRSYIHKLIETDMIKVNGNFTSKNYKIIENDKISVIIPEPENLDILPENIQLDIIYEDGDLLIVNKPKGMVVHPAPGNYSGTLVNALLYHCKDSLSGINGIARPGIVHRIDKDTSGLLIVAKNDKAHKSLAKQIKDHSFTREYEAVVHGNVKKDKGTVLGNIGRHKIDRKKMAVLKVDGRSAITHYEVISHYPSFTHLKLRLETGRTHQIRVHMASIGHPILGDEVYGIKEKSEFKFLKGQCLHAKIVGFIHPTTNEYMEFSSPLPEYFLKVLSLI